MSIKIHQLPGDPGNQQRKKRIGRGDGSNWGTYAGKGNKGQNARAGTGKSPTFEGGQMPLTRRLPKFGFSNLRFRKKRAQVTLAQLDRHFEDGAVVDLDALKRKHLVPKQTQYAKVLATGQLNHKLTVNLQGCSAAALEAIQAAGGSCQTDAS